MSLLSVKISACCTQAGGSNYIFGYVKCTGKRKEGKKFENIRLVIKIVVQGYKLFKLQPALQKTITAC